MEHKSKAKEIIFLLLSIAGTAFIAFLPCYESIMISGLEELGAANYVGLFTIVDTLMNITYGLPIYRGVMFLSMLVILIAIFWFISLIMDAVFLIKMLFRKRGYQLIKTLRVSWVFSLLYILVLVFIGLRMNWIASAKLNIDQAIIVPTTTGYAIITVMIINYFIFYHLYEKYATYSETEN